MGAWLGGFLAKIAASKLGQLILSMVIEKLLGTLKQAVSSIADRAVKFVKGIFRKKEQEAAIKKVEEDIRQGKPRNEETRKNESDLFNS